MKSLIVDKNNLKHNINIIKELAKQNTKCKIIGVVKGNGYGLGLIEYTRFLINNGIEMIAVATVEEAVVLRKEGIHEDILMLSTSSIEDDIKQLVKNNIIITIGSVESAQIANKIAKDEQKPIRAHIKIDTGFGRYGFLYTNPAIIIESIKSLKNISIEGMFSHLSSPYYENNKWTKLQFDRFIKVKEELKENNINIKMLHICESSAFLNYPNMHLNAVRIGSAFLGRVNINRVGLKKIGQLKTNITEIKVFPKGYNIGYLNTYKTKKETKVAIICIGDLEGYNIGRKQDMFRIIDNLRYLHQHFKKLFTKEHLKVIINNERYNVIGTIGMYHIAIDITDSSIKINDEVLLEVNPIYVESKIRREYI